MRPRFHLNGALIMAIPEKKKRGQMIDIQLLSDPHIDPCVDLPDLQTTAGSLVIRQQLAPDPAGMATCGGKKRMISPWVVAMRCQKPNSDTVSMNFSSEVEVMPGVIGGQWD
jgi:hypothetical protein